MAACEGAAMSKSQATVQVTKMVAAKRQLDSAIRLFFAKDDELAIHTLVAASFRVLRDITKKRGPYFGEKVLQNGFYSIAKLYSEAKLPEHVLKGIKDAGLLPLIEAIIADIRAEGDKFDRSRIRIMDPRKAEQRAWPSVHANFLKHADRDGDASLATGDIDNEVYLMGACASYVELMPGPPSPEMMAYISFWATKNEATPDVHPPARELANRLVSLKEEERYRACADWIADFKKTDSPPPAAGS
jgi:hypothetical protein